MIRNNAIVVLFSIAVAGCAFAQGDMGSALPDSPRAQHGHGVDIQELMRSNTHITRTHSGEDLHSSLEGLHAELHLISEVSSKLPSGSLFQARLEQPLMRDGVTVLPAGTVFEGRLETRPARRALRPGSLFLAFDRVLVPGAMAVPLSVNLVSTNSDAVKTDGEGALHPALSKKRLVVQLGGTALAAKFADDLAQAAGGTAVSAARARYIGAAAATAFFLLEKGREVKLHPGDSIEVQFGRTGQPLAVMLQGQTAAP